MPIKIRDSEKIVFIGDSITDCGRFTTPLGNGYVKLFSDLLAIREPQKDVTIINKGIGGNTVEDLRSRWYDDVISQKPDWLSVKIGINDLNRCICDKNFAFLTPEGFQKIYEEILAVTLKELPRCRIMLIDPFYMSRDKLIKEAYRARVLATIPSYIAVVNKMVKKYKTRHLETHKLFQGQLKYQHPDVYGQEPVHPNQTGHLLIAEAVYAELSK